MRNLKHQHRRRKFCVDENGKQRVSYLTVQAACASMAALLDVMGPSAQPLSVYRCKRGCGGLHVGHTPIEVRERYGL